MSEKAAHSLAEHALVVVSVGFQDALLLIIREFHRLEHHSDQVELDLGVHRHEVARQDVLQVLRVDAILPFHRQLVILVLVLCHQFVVLRLE